MFPPIYHEPQPDTPETRRAALATFALYLAVLTVAGYAMRFIGVM
jgi:hypothetical protein